MAERTNAYAESTGRSTTTSTSVGGANKVSLSHTPGGNETWLYLWNCEVDKSEATTDVLARFRNETAAVDWNSINIEPQDTTNRMSVFGGKVHTYGAAPGAQQIDIDYWCETSGTAGISDGHIFGMALTADDYSEETLGTITNATTTYSTALTFTETLTGSYLFLCFAEFNYSDTGAMLSIRADKGGTKYGSIAAWGPQDNTTWRTWGTGFVLEGLSGPQTVTIEFRSNSAGPTASLRNRRIIAISLDNFANGDFVENRTRDTNSTSTPEDQSSLTFVPAATRNHVAIGLLIGDHNALNTNGFYEFERDGAAINQMQEEPNQAGDSVPFFSVRRESLSVSTTYKTQKWSETTNITGAAESLIVVLDLEVAAVPPDPEPEPEITTFDLCPGEISVELVADTASGGRSLTGKRQYVQADAGFWRVVFNRIRIRSNEDVLAWRELEMSLNGRSGTTLVQLYDRKRAPIPVGGAPIVATADDPIPANAVSANIKVTTGAALEPGMHFSTGERAYRLHTVGTPAGNPPIYPVTFRPPAREAIADNAALEFDYPVCRCRLETDTAMNVTLDLMRDATPTVAFVEDV